MWRIPILLALILLANVAPKARAENVPLPISKRAVLQYNSEQYAAETRRQQELRTNLGRIEDDIGDLRKTMVRVAAQVKKQERDMIDLEDQVVRLQSRRTALQRKLQHDHKNIADMASALIRLRQIPTEALIARPGGPLQTAQAALILGDILGPIQLHALALRQDLTELDELEQNLKKKQYDIKKSSKKILIDQTKLAELVRRRERAYDSVKGDLSAQNEEMKRLAQDASDFKDLIKRLEVRNKALNTPSENVDSPTTRPHTAEPIILARLGDAQLPISGIIRVGYGATDDIGSESQGIKIEGRAGAIVVSPLGGVVRYQGKFKNYGNMLIIEHAKNYHSLVAGLAKIDTVVGQSVVSGEPLGTLGTTRSARPSLYYELRQNGKPVNPARIFADLS